jgi:hypothetical protein
VQKRSVTITAQTGRPTTYILTMPETLGKLHQKSGRPGALRQIESLTNFQPCWRAHRAHEKLHGCAWSCADRRREAFRRLAEQRVRWSTGDSKACPTSMMLGSSPAAHGRLCFSLPRQLNAVGQIWRVVSPDSMAKDATSRSTSTSPRATAPNAPNAALSPGLRALLPRCSTCSCGSCELADTVASVQIRRPPEQKHTCRRTCFLLLCLPFFPCGRRRQPMTGRHGGRDPGPGDAGNLADQLQALRPGLFPAVTSQRPWMFRRRRASPALPRVWPRSPARLLAAPALSESCTATLLHGRPRCSTPAESRPVLTSAPALRRVPGRGRGRAGLQLRALSQPQAIDPSPIACNTLSSAPRLFVCPGASVVVSALPACPVRLSSTSSPAPTAVVRPPSSPGAPNSASSSPRLLPGRSLAISVDR